MQRLLPDNWFFQFPVQVKPGKSTRIRGLTKLVMEHGPSDTEIDIVHHFTYEYGNTILNAIRIERRWPRFAIAGAHFAFVLAIIYKCYGGEESIAYVTDCLASDSCWTSLEDVGRGYEWYWLMAAVVLVETTNQFAIEDLFDRSKLDELGGKVNNIPSRDWIERKATIERCVDSVVGYATA